MTDLRLRLREIGSELVVRVGQPEEVIAKLVCQASSNVVFCHSEVTLEETEAQQRVEAAIKVPPDYTDNSLA